MKTVALKKETPIGWYEIGEVGGGRGRKKGMELDGNWIFLVQCYFSSSYWKGAKNELKRFSSLRSVLPFMKKWNWLGQRKSTGRFLLYNLDIKHCQEKHKKKNWVWSVLLHLYLHMLVLISQCFLLKHQRAIGS